MPLTHTHSQFCYFRTCSLSSYLSYAFKASMFAAGTTPAYALEPAKPNTAPCIKPCWFLLNMSPGLKLLDGRIKLQQECTYGVEGWKINFTRQLSLQAGTICAYLRLDFVVHYQLITCKFKTHVYRSAWAMLQNWTHSELGVLNRLSYGNFTHNLLFDLFRRYIYELKITGPVICVYSGKPFHPVASMPVPVCLHVSLQVPLSQKSIPGPMRVRNYTHYFANCHWMSVCCMVCFWGN